MKGDKRRNYKSHSLIFSLITIALVVLTAVGIAGDAAEYKENLNIAGIREALNGSTLVVLLAGLTLIISFIYLISSWRDKRHAKKELTAMALRAKEAQERGEDYTIEAPPIGKRVGSALSTVLDYITKAIIVIFILAIIATGAYSALKENEYRNRPGYDFLSDVDISPAISGYDGMGYVDEDLIAYTIPEDVTEILSTGNNYKQGKDYSEEQALWLQVKENLKFEMSPDTSDVGTLSNGDIVTVQAVLSGYNIPELQSKLGIRIDGLENVKEFEVSNLPHKFENAAQAVSEKSSFISLAAEKLRAKANKNCNDFKSSYYSNYRLVGAYLCKPDERPGYNPDALLLVATYDRQAGTEFAAQDTVILYAYPFDSRTEDGDIDNEFIPGGSEGVRVVSEIHTYAKPEQFIESFKTGRYLSGTAGYTLEEMVLEG